MSWEPWSRFDEKGLARYVSPEAKRWLPLDVSAFDVERQLGGRRQLAEAIYNALLSKDIYYALEEFHPSQVLQNIRTTAEILLSPRQGTCLDLAVLFCGVCMAYDLLPILVVIEGHALAAVSLTHGLRQRVYRPDAGLFHTGPLKDAGALRGLVGGEKPSYLAIECTGFAKSQMLGRVSEAPFAESLGREKGIMTFDRAAAAGKEQIEGGRRSLHFALDVSAAHFDWRIEPFSLIYDVLRESPESLARYLRTEQFETLVKERTRSFVGREFIFQMIDNLLGADRPLSERPLRSGYIVITGEPGLGKTALLSHLVKTRGYVHHFNVSLQSINSVRDFLGNVCAQLIIRYALPYETLREPALKDSGYLVKLLSEAVSKSATRSVIVLVDALDEAESTIASSGGRPPNRLLLPPVLPDGVCFIVSTRPDNVDAPEDYRIVADHVETIVIGDRDSRNKADVRRYTSQFLREHRTEMSPRLSDWNIFEEEFVALLDEKSDGNFMYLVHVLQDIRKGAINKENLSDISKLPSGLKAYYNLHWTMMEAADPVNFARLYKPVIVSVR